MDAHARYGMAYYPKIIDDSDTAIVCSSLATSANVRKRADAGIDEPRIRVLDLQSV